MAGSMAALLHNLGQLQHALYPTTEGSLETPASTGCFVRPVCAAFCQAACERLCPAVTSRPTPWHAGHAAPTPSAWKSAACRLLALTVTGSCLSEVLRDSFTEQ